MDIIENGSNSKAKTIFAKDIASDISRKKAIICKCSKCNSVFRTSQENLNSGYSYHGTFRCEVCDNYNIVREIEYEDTSFSKDLLEKTLLNSNYKTKEDLERYALKVSGELYKKHQIQIDDEVKNPNWLLNVGYVYASSVLSVFAFYVVKFIYRFW